MVKRFRIWEGTAGVRSQSFDIPNQSTIVNASSSTSLLSTDAGAGGRNNLLQFPAPTEFRKRQLIVAVTANSAECEKANDGGFDEVCSKPLTRADIHKVITRNFQYE